MAGESLSFDITATDRASSKFRDVGRSALDASAKVDIAAASMAAWDEAQRSSGKAANTSLQAFKAHAQASKLLADAENVLAGRATKTTKLFADQGRTVEDAGTKAASAASGFSALAGGGGLAGGGMGAAIAAGVALAPAVLSIGVGLAGLGAAAYGVAKPIENAAQKTGGLQKNLHLLNPEQQTVAKSLLSLGQAYNQFQQNLQPTLLKDFDAGIRLAGHLMQDVEPVALAVGKAIGSFVTGVDKTFQTRNWQQFFGFLARTAGPSIHDLTGAFTNLLQALPPIVEELSPLTAGLLKTAEAGTGLVNLAAHLQALGGNYTNLGNAATYAGKSSDATNQGIEQGIFHVIPALGILQGKSKEIAAAWNVLTGNVTAAGKAQRATAQSMGATNLTLSAQVKDLNMLAGGYERALGPLEKYIGASITEASDLHSLRQALKASGDQIGLKTQAERNSFSAAQTYIQDTISQGNAALGAHKGIDAQIRSIQNALPVLESVKGKTADYKHELDLLKGILDKLRAERTITENVKIFGVGRWQVGQTVHGIGGHTMATGGRVPGMGNTDSYPAMLTPGEAVVPKRLVGAVAPILRAGKVPGFADGGLVPSYSGNIPGLGSWAVSNQQATLTALGNAVGKALASSLSAVTQGGIGGTAGPGGGDPARNAALAYKLYASQMTPAMWVAWNYVAMRESGWNQFARNPSSGAYGIAQALPPTKYPFAGQAAGGSNPRAQITWMWNYMMASYGGPVGAAAHERAFNWYDNGGWLKPGLTLAYNGTGRPEMVVPNRGGAQKVVMEIQGGSGEFEQFMATMIRKYVRVRGGDVQMVFGRN